MLVVNTLGKFRISDGNEYLDERKLHSQMLIKLFSYMVVHKEKALTIEEIINAIWMEEEVDNPVGALKNLMYRLRKVLNDTFGQQEYIITNRGSYTWNPEIEILVDIEEFEKLIQEAKKLDDNKVACEKYDSALMFYEGRFMSQVTDLHWIHSLSTYYHAMFLDAVKAVLDIYLVQGNVGLVERICDKVFEIDATDEEIYVYKIKAYMYVGKIKQAMESYEIAKKRMQIELGINNSPVLEDIYQELLSMNNGDAIDDIEEIHSDVVEENPEGVFLCGYPVFKEIYQLEARKSIRSGLPNQMILFTIETISGENDAIGLFRIKQGMEQLERVMRRILRIGDVAAKYSDSQYVLLALNCDRECGYLVANRIVGKMFEGTSKYSGIKVKIDVEKVTCDRELE